MPAAGRCAGLPRPQLDDVSAAGDWRELLGWLRWLDGYDSMDSGSARDVPSAARAGVGGSTCVPPSCSPHPASPDCAPT